MQSTKLSCVKTRESLQELVRLAQESRRQLLQSAEDLRRLHSTCAEVQLERERLAAIMEESRRVVEEARRVQPVLGRHNRTPDARS